MGATVPSRRRASHISFARSLPTRAKRDSTGGVQASRSSAAERTFETRAPKCLCAPAHCWHTTTTRFRLAQSGSGAPQSAHCPFPGTEASAARTESAERGAAFSIFSIFGERFREAVSFPGTPSLRFRVGPMEMSSAMTPCRSETHARASASDSACSVVAPVGAITRKQYGRSAALLSPGSGPGFTHDTVRSEAISASESVASTGAMPNPAPVAGSGAAARATPANAAPIPRSADEARDAGFSSRLCFASPAPDFAFAFAFEDDRAGGTPPGPRRPCTKKRPAASRTKYRRVQPPNVPGLRSDR